MVKPHKIGLARFRSLVSEAASVFPEIEAMQDPEFAVQLFELLDVNHSSTISYEELFSGVHLSY